MLIVVFISWIYRVSQNYQLWRGSRGRIEKWFAYSWSPRSEMVDPPLFRPPKMSEFQHLRYCFCSQFWLNRSRRVCWYHFRSCPMPGSRDIHSWKDRGAPTCRCIYINLYIFFFIYNIQLVWCTVVLCDVRSYCVMYDLTVRCMIVPSDVWSCSFTYHRIVWCSWCHIWSMLYSTSVVFIIIIGCRIQISISLIDLNEPQLPSSVLSWKHRVHIMFADCGFLIHFNLLYGSRDSRSFWCWV